MDWDDEFDGMTHGSDSAGSMPDEDAESGLDPMDITDPASAYFLLSDDAQDEITGTDKKRMKCRPCGYRFTGEIYDRCQKCYSLNTEEAISVLEDKDDSSDHASMKCLDCGHTFVGGIYDRRLECFSSDTKQMTEENDAGSWSTQQIALSRC